MFRGQERKLKKAVQFFSFICTATEYRIKYHLVILSVRKIRRSETISILQDSAYGPFIVCSTKLQRRSTRRKAIPMQRAVMLMDQQQRGKQCTTSTEKKGPHKLRYVAGHLEVLKKNMKYFC